ncbi:hypothetical protein PVL29_006845 [Vitis rotundifolia]|uniref:Uncharacterized protein n=1 Tax=Vitis rotundifolia TaxID=103349 RepID=A0AA39DXJ0_VITRO|nr:hypothetical protein PVL29_006845 [Vitis rotundifolia]
MCHPLSAAVTTAITISTITVPPIIFSPALSPLPSPSAPSLFHQSSFHQHLSPLPSSQYSLPSVGTWLTKSSYHDSYGYARYVQRGQFLNDYDVLKLAKVV